MSQCRVEGSVNTLIGGKGKFEVSQCRVEGSGRDAQQVGNFAFEVSQCRVEGLRFDGALCGYKQV